MPRRTSSTGSELFIVDNSHEDWKVLRYLHDWCQLSKSIDIATGYFEIGSLLALQDEWQKVDHIRILMGDEVSRRTKNAFAAGLDQVKRRLDLSLETEKEKNDFLTGVSGIVEAIRSGKITCRVYRKDKFHAKAYITHARLEVVGSSALVGSANFTYPGLTENIELNVQITGQPVAVLQEWYEEHWDDAEDVSAEILKTIERHTQEYLPFDVYTKALHEFFRGHEMTAGEWEETRSKMFSKLDRYQKEAYWALMKIARQHAGAFLCDGVGLGKTFVGLMLIERLILHEGKRVVLFAPKAAKEAVWEPHLRDWLPHIGGVSGGADFSNLAVFSHTDLNRGGDFPARFRRITELADVVLIDEAHHFRNPGRQGDINDEDDDRSRYYRLYDVLDGSVRPKTLFMLTATPINNRLLMAPYAIAHMKIGLKLYETGYRFGSDERARIYLTNALEPWQRQLKLPDFEALAHEAAAVNEIKRHKRFTVVIGNPPYSGLSANMSEEAAEIIEPYKHIAGIHFGERKHWLHDDYVKFFRLSETRVNAAGIGILGLITNHAFYDNPTFRGMRWNLLQSFDRIRLLDLHGNTMKREKSSDGSEDKNVFDIQQGVAISLFSKLPTHVERLITYGELWGPRDRKYSALSREKVNALSANQLSPAPDFYFFVPRVEDHAAEYGSSLRLNEIFAIFAGGFITARDHFIIDFDRAELLGRIEAFADASVSDTKIRERYFAGCGSDKYPDGDTRGWKVPDARKRIRKDPDWEKHVYRCLYRPFDTRWIYWTDGMVDWPRPEVNGHLLNEGNLALVFMRQVATGDGYSHFIVSRLPVDNRACYSNKGIMTLAPLYLHKSAAKRHGELSFDEAGARANFTPPFLAALRAKLGSAAAKLTPKDVFDYAYAVFHSPGYRSRYAEFLKIDFPRLPLTGNLELFRLLAGLGGELVGLHLLESPKLDKPLTTYTGSANPEVDKISHARDTVWLDKGQTRGFRGLPEAVWNFHIGGYQVCEKWLKDRKGRTLSKDDIAHYHKIVVALSETIRLMEEIDKVIEKHGGWPGAFQSTKVRAEAP